MMTLEKEKAIRKIAEMPVERVSKVLIFMAGMEAEHIIDEKSEIENLQGGEAGGKSGKKNS